MNNKIITWIIVVLVVVAGIILLTKGDKLPADTAVEPVTVVLATQNASGEQGTVTMADEGGKTKVTVTMTGAPATAQPAHIHMGACPTPGAVKYPLTDIVAGTSVTMIDASLAQIKTELPLAINVHKSAAEISIYVACGDINL